MLRISSQNSSKDQRILLSDPNWAFLTGHKDSIKDTYKNMTAPEDFKLTPYDGIRTLVGNLESKERKEFLENWKNRAHSFVEKMSKGPSNFFNLAALALHNSVNLGQIVWDHLPTIDINRANPHIERVALCDWQFNQLPAISNANVKWDDVGSLISRLNKLKIPGFWNEPLLEATIDYKSRLAENLSYSQIEDTLVVQILMAIHSGRYEQLLECANTYDLITPTSREKVFPGFMERVQPKLNKALNFVLSTEQPRHYIKPGTVIGTFKPSTQMSNFVSNEMNTSVTCDDKYLYMILNEYGKGQFLKVGSGMKGTIPGKVYLSKNSNITYLGNLSIVWVNGKLVVRSTNDKIGRLKIFNPETLDLEREVRFFDQQIAGENKLQELNRNYPLLSDGKRLFAILTRFKRAEHVVKQEMQKYFDKAFEHQNERKGNKKDQHPNNAIRKSEIMRAQLMETALYEVHLDSNQEITVRSERDVKPEEAPLLNEMYDSFCGLYPMHTCYVALKVHNWDFEKAADWLMQQGDQEATKKTINITRHCLIAQSEITGESHKVGQQYLLNASILSPLHSQMLHSGLWTMTGVNNGKMELTLHCNSPQRGNCAKIFTISEQPSEQTIPYDPDNDIFVWQSQQLAEFNGNLNQGQPPPGRARPRGRGGMMRRGKRGGGPSQLYRGRGRGRGGYKTGNLFGQESQNSGESDREQNDEEDMSEGGDDDDEEEGGPPQGRQFNHNPYLSPAKGNQGEGVHHYITTLRDLGKMDAFYQKIYEEYEKAIDQDIKERNKQMKEGRLFE